MLRYNLLFNCKEKVVLCAAGNIRAEERSKHTSTDKRGRTGDTHNGVGERWIKEPISTAIKSKTEKSYK